MLLLDAPRPALRAPRPAGPAAPATSTRPRETAVLALAPAALLLVLGAWQLSRHLALWYDEDYTLLAVQTPLPQLLTAVWHASPLVSWLTVAPSFNAPWYVLMHGWCAVFGTSALALRVPALVCSAAAVGVLALAVRRLAGPLAGLTAGLLAATGPLLAAQAVEARSYGAAELATAVTALLLVRRVQDGGRRRGLALAAGAAGLLHWFALPVMAALALWSVGARRRRGLGDALAIGLATLPALGLVVLQLRGGGDGTPITEHVGALLPVHALRDWASGVTWLTLVLVAAFAVALVRSRWRGLLAAWVAVPLALSTVLELLRPVYFGRYELFALLGLAAGAAIGAASLPGRWRRVACAGLVCASLAACVPHLQASAREHPDQVVALLEAQQVAGQPVAAGDGRAAIELEEEVTVEDSRLAADLLLRPAHVAVGGSATTAWLVRSGSGARMPASPDLAYLAAGGYHLARTIVVPGAYGDLTLQEWVR